MRQPLRHVVDAGVLAVHGAEPVADVDVGEPGELVGERAALGVVLGRLARVEAEVLEQGDLAVGETVDRRLGALADGVGRRTRRRGRAPRRAGRRPARASTGRSGAPLGRPRWAQTTTRAPRSARSAIVGALARMRPSSVIRCRRGTSSGTLRSRPDEDPRSATQTSPEVGRAVCRSVAATRHQSERPTRPTRSTRRLE